MSDLHLPSQWPNGVIVGEYVSGPLVGEWVIVEAVESVHGDAEPERYRVLAPTLPITLDDGSPVILPAEHSPQSDRGADVLAIMRRDLPLRWSTSQFDIERAYRWNRQQDGQIVAGFPPKERRLVKYLRKFFSSPTSGPSTWR